MSPEDGSSGTPGAEIEIDEPIQALIDHELETAPDFMARVRGKIYRRTATSHLAAFSWHLPKLVLMEMAGLLTHLFRMFGTKKDS